MFDCIVVPRTKCLFVVSPTAMLSLPENGSRGELVTQLKFYRLARLKPCHAATTQPGP